MDALNPLALISEGTSMSIDPKERARTQALCWLLDELFDAEEDLVALFGCGAIGGCKRERLEGSVSWWGRSSGGSEPWGGQHGTLTALNAQSSSGVIL